METIIRGFIEKQIDFFLTKEFLSERAKTYKEFQKLGLLTSIESAIFGAFWENMIDSVALIRQRTSSKITVEDVHELFNIIKNRSLEIKSKIREASAL